MRKIIGIMAGYGGLGLSDPSIVVQHFHFTPLVREHTTRGRFLVSKRCHNYTIFYIYLLICVEK